MMVSNDGVDDADDKRSPILATFFSGSCKVRAWDGSGLSTIWGQDSFGGKLVHITTASDSGGGAALMRSASDADGVDR